MMHSKLLVALVGPIFVPNKQKLAFQSTRCVFLGYSPLHKGVKCLNISTGRVYISQDVVFDENVFPIASLHPNAGALLKKEILLLPSSTSNSHVSAHNCNDHSVPIVSITNVEHEDAASEENFSQNGEETSSKIGIETQSTNDENSTENNVDSARHSSGQPDPKEQRSEADSPASSPYGASRRSPCRSESHVSAVHAGHTPSGTHVSASSLVSPSGVPGRAEASSSTTTSATPTLSATQGSPGGSYVAGAGGG
jgi:hypothetical protein